MAFSQKQLQVLMFPKSKFQALICDGAIRSGKTAVMSLSFVLWAMHAFDGRNFAICGKTVQSCVRNVIQPLLGVTYFRRYGFWLHYSVANHYLTVSRGGKTNRFYVFGGRDESSYTLIQGITLAGVLFDEVALMPRSFVEQAMARCSVRGSKFWFNCNPEGPQHWFYREWVLEAESRGALHLHFTMDDNPGIDAEIKERYERMYAGVFYDRYIRGAWAVAEGLIYPDQAAGMNIEPAIPREYEQYYISVDYGTLNPFSAGLWGLHKGVWYRFDEYRYSGREQQMPLTDEDYCDAIEQLASSRRIAAVIVDPSAASFITALERRGRFYVRHAANAVLDGIRDTATAFKQGKIKVCKNCSGAIEEFKEYRWDEKSSGDKPLKENDHAMDEIRYFVETVLSGNTFSFE